mmetsp:Transcript_23437/g.76288  ORF Transcript_23437/g.76288 Transcript_23437/m.76288 type:complete len:211 (+) Transcript_23437:171-803(+)
MRLAPLKSAKLASAWVKSAPSRLAPTKLTDLRFAPPKLAPLSDAPSSLAHCMSTPSSLAPSRFMLLRSAFCSSAHGVLPYLKSTPGPASQQHGQERVGGGQRPRVGLTRQRAPSGRGKTCVTLEGKSMIVQRAYSRAFKRCHFGTNSVNSMATQSMSRAQYSWHSASVTACQMGSVCIVVGPAHPPALRPGPGGCQRATLLGPRVVKTGV